MAGLNVSMRDIHVQQGNDDENSYYSGAAWPHGIFGT